MQGCANRAQMSLRVASCFVSIGHGILLASHVCAHSDQPQNHKRSRSEAWISMYSLIFILHLWRPAGCSHTNKSIVSMAINVF